jgi:hypothetical protein
MQDVNDEHQPSWRRIRLAGAVTALHLGAQAAYLPALPASPGAGCAAINRGELDIEIGPGLPVTRSLDLEAGETIVIFPRGSADLSVAVSVVAGRTVMSTLRTGPGASSASFASPEHGNYTMRLVAERGAGTLSATCSPSAAAGTSAPVEQSFLTRRADRLAAEEPDRARLARREPGLFASGATVPGVVKLDESNKPRQVALSVSLAEIAAAGAQSPAPSGILDFWFEGRYGNFDANLPGGSTSDASLGVLYVGAQLKPRPEIMLGTLAQFDQTEEADPRAQARAAGWMAGPYASVQLAPGVFLDGRAAWGLADVDLVDGAAADAFAAERRLVRGRLAGTREFGAWRFSPSVALSYFEESRRDGTHSASSALEHQSTGQGRIDVLPQLSYRTHLDRDTFIEPRAAVGAFWNFDALDKLVSDSPHGGPEDMRLKAEAGVAIGTKEGASLNATGGLEGAGQGVPDIWSGRLQLNVPLK